MVPYTVIVTSWVHEKQEKEVDQVVEVVVEILVNQIQTPR
jgi:hypothetical protein